MQKEKRYSNGLHGAAAKGITLINFSKIGHDTLEYIIDKNPAKQK